MPDPASSGALSLVPVALALVLAFWTRNAAFSLLVGCTVGGVLAGFDPATIPLPHRIVCHTQCRSPMCDSHR